MASEMVFTVAGTDAVAATPIGLAEAGLKEREHLQEWVLQHPQILGDDVKVISFEFGRWTGSGGGLERDRLDVLGLDTEGRLVVVELKRDKAPDTVDMQALKYAALVSRFTREDLDKVHAQYLSRLRGEALTPDEAGAELDDWATVTEDSLRVPRLILMASSFPRTVTATVVFLHQQLGLDVRLLAFQAYKTATDVLLTVSQHYPPPDVEEFVLSPEVNEARQQRTAKQTKKREATAVSRLLGAEALEPGAPLEFRSPIGAVNAEVAEWIAEDPRRGRAAWQEDLAKPLVWEFDGQPYSPTGLAALILEEAAGRTQAIQGPACWFDQDGASLVELAKAIPAGSEVPLEVHLAKLNDGLRPVFDAVDAAILALGSDVTRQSRVKSIKYYGQRKLADLLIHNDHLSLYIRGLTTEPADPQSLIARYEPGKYLHAKVSAVDDVVALVELLRPAYTSEVATTRAAPLTP
ncbi:DUF91 domain-containing protein [Iamia sp. SCSIO 61187]|uniref:DUF5655 domain-containing protein n=1 Tax=Iamia sp. SCSIO 61187 TaxID=2722752 RepID=UPI001C626D2A|nr:DUF5655 domain-containing protein [Iamia sp. SCSIO 61187]QYG91071.1 DUF91 domain-containing protein [Iamia sp. SCSIO 61187]